MPLLLQGQLDHTLLDLISDPWIRHWAADSTRIFKICRNQIGVVQTNARHLYHGNFKNRLYRERWEWLLEGNFDPTTDIEHDSQGLWQWTALAMEDKPQMVADVASYFALRKEDE